MPLGCAKSLQIQSHNMTGDELKKLDRRTQFETGLTGTPYATDRSICFPESDSQNSGMISALPKWQLLTQIRITPRLPFAFD